MSLFKRKNHSTYLFAFAGLIMVGLLGYTVFVPESLTTLDPIDDVQVETEKTIDVDKFAEALTEAGAKFYGAWWCGHCQNQKEMFGNSFNKIDYIECSLPESRERTQECIDVGITGYPTWEFADGSRQSGEIPFEYLAEYAGIDLESVYVETAGPIVQVIEPTE
ncbi:MAG: hypothetical protein ABIH67_02295 [Candidatus Uhrbacteria bacterium]